MSDHINSKDFIIGALIGGTVGASLALIFAPKSGREIRKDINQGAVQMKDRATEWKDNAVQAVGSEWKDKAFEKGSELKQKALNSTSQIRHTVSNKAQDITKSVQEKFQ